MTCHRTFLEVQLKMGQNAFNIINKLRRKSYNLKSNCNLERTLNFKQFLMDFKLIRRRVVHYALENVTLNRKTY